MSRRSFLDLPNEKRLLILTTAAHEFAAHGFDGASLNRIIDLCGMSKSSFYYYFDDKAELFQVVIERGLARLVSDLEIPAPDSLAGDKFWASVERIFDRIVEVGSEQPWYLAIATIFYQAPATSGTPAVVTEALERAGEWVARALAAGQGTGAIRTDLPFDLLTESVFALLQALDRWSARNAANFSPEELQNVARVQADFLRRMLSPAP